MVAAGATELVNYLGIRETAARRWAEIVYSSMVLVVVEDRAPPDPGVRYPWTPQDVRAYLMEWSDTLKRTPSRIWPQRLKAVWPTMISEWTGYGAAEIVTLPHPPSAAAISRMDGVTQWLMWLTEDARLLVSGRADKVPWQRLAERVGFSERTCRYRYPAAIDSIHFRLTRTWPRVHPFEIREE